MSVTSEGTWESYRLKNLSDKSCYITGGITGVNNYLELFEKAKSEVQKLALVPINPCELVISDDYQECMKVDITVMMRCAHVYVLNNYKTSRGATMELAIAQFLGLNIIYQPDEEIMKYIMFEVQIGDMKRKVPIIFPTSLVHSEVAKALCKLDGLSKRIVGAGELSIRTTGCHGESTTLGIKSKKGDKEIINTYDYLFGMEGADPKIIDKMLAQLFRDIEDRKKKK